jgi:uncharacterized protein YndB with AHSA1/START domain
MEIHDVPIAQTGMLIRRPVADVFEAFVDPAITSKFWFTKGSGKLEPGKRVQWDWEMYGHSVNVDVKAVERNKRIEIEWSPQDGHGPSATVEWTFSPRAGDATFVTVTNKGFYGDGDMIVKQALDSMSGFSFVLSGAKAVLEHDVELNLIADRYPEGH